MHLAGRAHLLLADFLVLLPLCCRLEPLPRQTAPQEVHQHIAHRLHVISPALLNAQVCVDGRIAGRAGEVLIFPVRDVDVGLGVAVLLGQAKVNDVHLIMDAGGEAQWGVSKLEVDRQGGMFPR